jgi:hypothetical protein
VGAGRGVVGAHLQPPGDLGRAGGEQRDPGQDRRQPARERQEQVVASGQVRALVR